MISLKEKASTYMQDGDIYEGDWKNNKANGYGKFT